MAGVDRDYWLDFAKDGISKSIEKREKAAEKLDTLLIWIWSIYTSIFVLASFFNYMTASIGQLVLVAQPVLVIMIARFYCALVMMPSIRDDGAGDPNVIPEIIDAFFHIVKDKKRKLKNARIATVIAMISLSIALIGYNLADPNRELKRKIQSAKLNKDLNDQVITSKITQ